MLGLQMPTDPRWAELVQGNIAEILTDHAWCEQKAATNAISIIVKNPGKTDLVNELTIIAQEEIEHFQMVHQKIQERGFTLGAERKDEYVRDLSRFIKQGGTPQEQLVANLLFSAMIEARSCERFRMLSERLEDEDLCEFYRELMISEANHYTVFLGFARKYGGREKTDVLWNEFLEYEAGLMEKYGKKETMHG
ncbi:MAG: tRNA-(ms[2]io[6]A)-hydroxylase [Flavobacteriales bacterium]|nr:tRNA-(ms[2]io[6]A)-hydroxylase [Flavobacteriales bacterium]